MPLNTNFRLYFGRTRPDGGYVFDDEFAAFERTEIARIFPDGFTVTPARGAWRDAATAKTIRERTTIVDILADLGEGPAVEALARRYADRFAQDCVLVVASPATVSFVGKSPADEATPAAPLWIAPTGHGSYLGPVAVKVIERLVRSEVEAGRGDKLRSRIATVTENVYQGLPSGDYGRADVRRAILAALDSEEASS
jgi:hypothetical protein